MRLRSIAGLFALSALFGCEDNASVPTPQPEPVKTFDFSFRYDPLQEITKEYELIVSQKDGKILLDTLIATRATHNLKLKTEDTKFDVTTISLDPINNNRYTIKTYVQVNPDKWHIADVFNPIVIEQTQLSRINYYNIPYDNKFYFASMQEDGTGASWPGTSDHRLALDFFRISPNDLAYLLLPSQGKYLFTEVTSAQTEVDFSKASTSEKRKFERPAGINSYRSFLYGYTKAGDYSKRMLLYFSDRNPTAEYDLQYPLTVIQEFELFMEYTDAEKYSHTYYNLGATIPTTMDYMAKSDFTVTKSDFNDFQVQFGDDKPSTYAHYWVTTDASLNAGWHINVSPTNTSFNPKLFLENLKAKSLAGKAASAFRLRNVYSQKVKDFTHQDMYDHLGNPAVRLKKAIKQSRTITRYY